MPTTPIQPIRFAILCMVSSFLWPNVRRDLAVACRHAGIPRVSPNDLRRTFASWLKQRGVDSMVVARLLGHSSTAMVERVYGRLN